MQATMAIFLGFPGGDEADVELPDDGIEPDGSQRGHVEATPHLATTAEDGTLVTHLAGIAVEGCHADQGADLAAREVCPGSGTSAISVATVAGPMPRTFASRWARSA